MNKIIVQNTKLTVFICEIIDLIRLNLQKESLTVS